MSDERKKEKTPRPTVTPAGDVESRRPGGGDEMAAGTFARLVFRRAIDALHREWVLSLERSE